MRKKIGLFIFTLFVGILFVGNVNASNIYKDTCLYYTDKDACEKQNDNISCVWNENESAPNKGYCNVDNLLFVKCGDTYDIPKEVPALISFAINLIKIATPIILIFISMITLIKALSASKEDEIKKAQSGLVKKIIAAALVFFIVSIVQFVITKVADSSDKENISDCLKCFLTNNCEDTMYYRTSTSYEEFCTKLTTGKTQSCDVYLGLEK